MRCKGHSKATNGHIHNPGCDQRILANLHSTTSRLSTYLLLLQLALLLCGIGRDRVQLLHLSLQPLKPQLERRHAFQVVSPLSVDILQLTRSLTDAKTSTKTSPPTRRDTHGSHLSFSSSHSSSTDCIQSRSGCVFSIADSSTSLRLATRICSSASSCSSSSVDKTCGEQTAQVIDMKTSWNCN